MASNHTIVPNTMGKQAGLGAAWINHLDLSTFPVGNVRRKRVALPNETQPSINLLRPACVIAEPTFSALIYECGRVFYDLQQRRYGVTGGQAQAINFVNISYQYRSCVRHALDRLNRLTIDTPPAADGDDKAYHNLISMLYSIECTWHLVEFLILDTNSSSVAVVSSLLEWVRYHFPGPGRQATELLKLGSRNIDRKENYWPVVKGLIRQGQTTVARMMLRVHTNSETHCFQAADQLLHSLPIYSVHDGLSVHKYQTQWRCWRDNVRTLISAGNFGAEPQLEEILRLVIGDRAAWREQLSEATRWYEYFPGFLLYTDSSCRYYQLGHYANNWMMDFVAAQKKAADTIATAPFTYLDKLVLAVMENNLPELLQQLRRFPDNRWCAVHIVDLLYHAGLLDASRSDSEQEDGMMDQTNTGNAVVQDGKLIRDNLLYNFGCLLMCEGTHWLLGMDYLEFSNSEGLGAREALLGRVPFQNETQAIKLIAIARKNNYPDVVMEICKVLTKRNLAIRRYGSALEWAIRTRDSSYVRDVANIFLEHYCNHGELLCEKQVANLGSNMFISSRLVFLKKYYDFRQLYREQAYAKAAELLVSLMDSKIMPSYFWPCLMSDAIPLLEFKEPIIPSKETLVILEHLQMDLVPMLEQRQQEQEHQRQQQNQWTGAKNVLETPVPADENTDVPMDEDQTALLPKFSSNLLNNCTEDLVNMLRLACARNLSRALIIENTVSG